MVARHAQQPARKRKRSVVTLHRSWQSGENLARGILSLGTGAQEISAEPEHTRVEVSVYGIESFRIARTGSLKDRA